MAATSVTGTGLGDSNGQYKSENNGGCCGKTTPTENASTSVKLGCSIKHRSCCGKKVKSCCNARIKNC